MVRHTRGMADLDRRSEDRRAQVVVRMSASEREAIRSAAERQGVTMNDLILSRVADLVLTGKRSA